MKLVGIEGGTVILPTEVLLFWYQKLPRVPSNEPDKGRTPSGNGTEDGRSTDSTEEAGPMKRW